MEDLGDFDVDKALMAKITGRPANVPAVQVQPTSPNVATQIQQDFGAAGGGVMTHRTFTKQAPAEIKQGGTLRVEPTVKPVVPAPIQRTPRPVAPPQPKPVSFDGQKLVQVEVNAPLKVSQSTPSMEPVEQAPVEKPVVPPTAKKVAKKAVQVKSVSSSDLEEAEPIKDVMILRPVLRDVHSLVHHATLAVFDKNTMGYDAQTGDAIIAHSRNLLADRFMKSDYEWALWWDDDVVPPIGNAAWSKQNIQSMPGGYPDKFLNINPVRRLQSHGKTIIGGLYFGRKRPWAAICERTTQTVGQFANVPRVEIRPVGWVGTGFLLVHRSVFEDVMTRFKGLAPKAGAVNPYEKVWDFFKPDRDQAEDVSFCQRAKECGHQPYVDLSVVCTHVGDYCFGPWNNQ